MNPAVIDSNNSSLEDICKILNNHYIEAIIDEDNDILIDLNGFSFWLRLSMDDTSFDLFSLFDLGDNVSDILLLKYLQYIGKTHRYYAYTFSNGTSVQIGYCISFYKNVRTEVLIKDIYKFSSDMGAIKNSDSAQALKSR